MTNNTHPSNLKVRRLTELPQIPQEEIGESVLYATANNKDYKVGTTTYVDAVVEQLGDELAGIGEVRDEAVEARNEAVGAANLAAVSASEAEAAVVSAEQHAAASEGYASDAEESANLAEQARLSGPPIGYSTRAEMEGNTSEDAGALALVTNDPNPDNNGTWRWSGTVWVQSADRVSAVEQKIVTTSNSRDDARLFGVTNPNRFTVSDYLTPPETTAGGVVVAPVREGGKQGFKVTARPGGVAGVRWYFNPGFASSGVVTAGMEIVSSDAGNISRFRYMWRAGGRTGSVLRTDDFNEPFSGISVPAFFRHQMTVPAGADTLEMQLLAYGTDRETIFGKMMLVDGDAGAYVPPKDTQRIIYLAETGSDVAAGTSGDPVATLSEAVARLGGSGTVVVAAGNYTRANFTLPYEMVQDLEIVGAERSLSEKRPLIRYGLKLEGITHHSGKVYWGDATAASITTLGRIWQDGVPDATTLVPANERHGLLRGREHRLPCTAIKRTTASTLAAAVDEIEASANPKCFYDNSTKRVYFSIAGGGDATSADIYVPSANGGVFDGPIASHISMYGRLTLRGLEFRYASINFRTFTSWYAENVSVLGARLDNFYLRGVGEAVHCESMGADGGGSSGGDGFNAHGFAVTTLRDCYTHDNNDDGESHHENGVVAAYGCVSEYNGSAGFIPASGAHGRYHNCVTRKNSQTASSYAGFDLTGAPVAGDDGVDTTSECFNCISYDDPVGFNARSSQRLVATNCTAIGSNVGFNSVESVDCRYSGPGTARIGGSAVNTTPVT